MERVKSPAERMLAEWLLADTMREHEREAPQGNPFPGCLIGVEWDPRDRTRVRFVLSGPWTDQEAAAEALASWLRGYRPDLA